MLFLTLNTYTHTGGIETFNKYFIEALIQNGFKYESLALYDKKSASRIKHHTFGGSKITFIWKLLSLSFRSKTIVWGHINLLPLLLLFYPLFRKKNNILIIHGLEIWDPRFKTFLKKKALTHVDQVWSVSNYTKRRFLENYRFSAEKIQIFPNTIKRKNGSFPNPYKGVTVNLLSILRLENPAKVLSILAIVEVLADLLINNSLCFYVIGEGRLKKDLQAHVKQLGLEKNVIFLGFVEETAPYLQHCDVFCLMSKTEGFGIVLLEAMEFAKPCIAAKETGAEDVIVDGVTGFLIDPNNSLELKEKIQLLISDPVLRSKMGEMGKQIFEQKFNFDRFKEKQKHLLLLL